MSAAGAGAAEPALRAPWGAALGILLPALVLLGLVFAEEGAAAVRVWEGSAAYNHCWLVGPMAAWLAWTRRGRLSTLRPVPALSAALLALPLGLGWLAAERLGIMEGRQLAALLLAETAVVAVLGWRVARAMAAPLFYLVFLVPMGAFLTPWLQQVTTWFIDIGLDVLRIPHYIDGFVIELPTATFLVAEACAGLRFLIAAATFGAFYALEMFRSPGRRAIVLVLSVLVPVMANGARAFGLVLLGHHWGDAEAALADHVTYGWVFFSIVMLLLILAGLPFREDGAEPARPAAAGPLLGTPTGLARRLAVAAAVLLLGMVGPAVAAGLARAGGAETPRIVRMDLVPMPGCEVRPDAGGLACGPLRIEGQVLLFSARTTWAAAAGERHRVLGADDTARTWRTPVAEADAVWEVVQPREGGRVVALAAFLSGQPTGGGLRSRIRQARNSLGLTGGRPALAVLEIGGAAGLPRERIEAILAAQPELAARALLESGR